MIYKSRHLRYPIKNFKGGLNVNWLNQVLLIVPNACKIRMGMVTMGRVLFNKKDILRIKTAAVAQWVRAFAPQEEGWVFESQPQ